MLFCSMLSLIIELDQLLLFLHIGCTNIRRMQEGWLCNAWLSAFSTIRIGLDGTNLEAVLCDVVVVIGLLSSCQGIHSVNLLDTSSERAAVQGIQPVMLAGDPI